MEPGLRTIPGNHCTVHGYHWPKPMRTVKHHIHPLAHGGPDTKANLVLVCDTGHYNIHDLLAQLMLGLPMFGGTRAERTYAAQGYEAIMNHRRTTGEWV
jgi:hypothetical protein